MTLGYGCEDSSKTTTDAGKNDAGSTSPPWSWCPDSSAYVGDASWAKKLLVPAVTMCWSAPEREPLAVIKEKMLRLRFTEGTYGLPTIEEGQGSIALPVCFEKNGHEGPRASGMGVYQIELFEEDRALLEIQLDTDLGQLLKLSSVLSFDEETDAWPDLVIEGHGLDGHNGTFRINVGDEWIASCDFSDFGQEFSRSAIFANGDSIRFSFRAVPGSISTGPSGSHRVTGTIDDHAIDIKNYHQILYSPSHHHFGGGDHAVIFDAPLRGACGLRVNATGATPVASLIDCDLNDVKALEIVSTDP